MNKKDILFVSLLSAGNGYCKEYHSSYKRYHVLINGTTRIEDLYTREELKALKYWSNRSNVLAVTCWGTSQLFEAQLALASFLGMREEGEDWGAYTRRATDFIKAI